jgi:hypothetical protein
MEHHKNNENKIHDGVNQPPIGKSTHDNQPKEVVHNRGQYGEDACPGVSMGGVRHHYFGGNKVQI